MKWLDRNKSILIPDAAAFALQIGLTSSDNYSSDYIFEETGGSSKVRATFIRIHTSAKSPPLISYFKESPWWINMNFNSSAMSGKNRVCGC
jgi:hypothetical protein